MLCKLAWGNVRRAGRDYTVYLLTLSLAVMVFYAFNTISVQVSLVNVEKGMSELMGSLISGVTVFLAALMGFLMVYANNFIMRRRKKEFGLYQVLGMGRGQVARVMALETLIVSAAALVLGLALGCALSQLMVFFTAALFRAQTADFHFFFSWDAFGITVACLVAVFLISLVCNLFQVARSQIVDLMGAGRRNEAVRTRNPWLAAAVFVAGAALVGVAYARLGRDGLPLTADGMPAFAITTALVVVGTLLLFFGLSGFLLKVLQAARGLYWRGLNMFTLRQLAAKVNTVSLSMAVIAMILFLAITSVTSGMSLMSALNSDLDARTPADWSRTFLHYSEESAAKTRAYAREAGEESTAHTATEPVDLMAAAGGDTFKDGTHFDLSKIAGAHVQVDQYDSTPRGAREPLVSLTALAKQVGSPIMDGVMGDDASSGLTMMRASDFNRYLAFRELPAVDLGRDGYLITSDSGEALIDIYDKVMARGTTFDLAGRTLHPVADAVDAAMGSLANNTGGMSNAGTLVVPDDVLDALDLPLYASNLLVNYKRGVSTEQGDAYVARHRSYASLVEQDGVEVGFWGVEFTRTAVFQGVDSLRGMVSYLAIYIGFVLVVGCAAILTIQQLSSVADAGPSCRILTELGTPRRQIERSALAQQMVFFLFPLVVGAVHAAVALAAVMQLVRLFGGVSIEGTVGLAVAIFLLAYGGYFMVTYLMSRGIIRDAVRTRHAA